MIGSTPNRMNDEHTIRLGIGIGDLQFGASRAEAHAYLGEAEEIIFTEGEEDDDETSIHWLYPTRDFWITFEAVDGHDYRFESIETSSPDARHGDVKPIGISRADALLWLEGSNLGEVTGEFWDLEDGDGFFGRLSPANESLIVWLENGVVTELQWWPRFDASDEKIWPS